MEAEVAIFDKNLSNMPTLQKINQKLNPMIPSTKLHHFSFFRAIFAFLATHPVHSSFKERLRDLQSKNKSCAFTTEKVASKNEN